MILKRSILSVAFMLSGLLYSQANVTFTLPLVTLMDVEPAGSISLIFTAPTEAGNALGNPTPNMTKWINYSSAIASGGLSRRITASVSQLIPGVNIRIQAAAASGAGGGTLGTSAGQITLTTTPTTIISGIGGAYTGNGANNGHRLTISLVPGTYASLSAQANTTVSIVYTITE
ncbi:hypothetical protein H3Z85_05595 [Chryseobacterium indologenes]|uniref:Uncharacterized protein n=1 Tax=Chryseobacterium indologenes TaxID=253 RepID=A0A1Z3W5C9_CHRID|nr:MULTISPECIES: hypothetical protein [Chryseobacterium]ASE62958.1 hypothetical protein CEQ15_16400 [Chryseobacterium indologenes]ATN06874.1 hypothetical protein CRN76_16390 [Chryseobacterium indologenes]AYY84380.1 hypothetical protein EGX91_07405 [Chryseobacterium indologenes]AYZ34138.1 hypothetical protein EGY07_00465 [Chryseobacterium indologenes]AZB18661.1 hypothetical protein EG352_13155 [Chryseobacterium indologenes]